MNKIHGEFCFYPVGQGCFYAGNIYFGGQKFTIVYDCGTISKWIYLSNAIKEFKERNKKIDLLIVSHFDSDHVNGIKDLLTGLTCERVIIPYYNPITRLMLWSTVYGDGDYSRFMSDPINYFLNTTGFDVKEVVVVGNDGEIFNGEPLKAPAPIQPKDNNLIESQQLKFVDFIEHDTTLREKVKTKEDVKFKLDNRVKFVKLPFNVSFSFPIWDFVFYLKFWDPNDKILAFEKAINGLLAREANKTIADLFNEDDREDVMKIYEEHIDIKINYSSLVVFHYPIGNDSQVVFNKSDKYCYCLFCSDKKMKPGTLLTGDQYLKAKKDFDAFFNYFGLDYFNMCGLMQVPHHGAKANWKPLPNGLENIYLFVINHGLGRKHPFPEVVENILKNSTFKSLKCNNESNRLEYIILSHDSI